MLGCYNTLFIMFANIYRALINKTFFFPSDLHVLTYLKNFINVGVFMYVIVEEIETDVFKNCTKVSHIANVVK